MTRIKLAVFAGSALLATPAFADDTTEPAAGGTVEAGGTATAGGAGTGMEATGTATGEAPTWWSRSAIDRPYIVGKGKIGAYGGYNILQVSFNDGMGNSGTLTGDLFGIGAGYGVTDKITAGLQYGFTPGVIGDADSEIKGGLQLFGEYQIKHDAKLDITASADFDLNLCGSRDTMNECSSTMGISAGLGARYTLAPKMAVFTGSPYGPGPVGAAAGVGLFGPSGSQHLSISFEDGNATSFQVPVGFMYQATPELNVHLDTNLAYFAFNDAAGDSSFIFADFIPLALGGLYSVTPNVDLTALFQLPDLKEVGFDAYLFGIGARYNN